MATKTKQFHIAQHVCEVIKSPLFGDSPSIDFYVHCALCSYWPRSFMSILLCLHLSLGTMPDPNTGVISSRMAVHMFNHVELLYYSSGRISHHQSCRSHGRFLAGSALRARSYQSEACYISLMSRWWLISI